MGFTTPCFIRKNAPKLQEKLKNIGYRSLDNDNDKRDGLVADRNGFMYSIFEKNVLGSTYNCGTNEELFLAIASLRDDTDDNQLFTNGKGDWGICRDGSDGGLPGMDFYGIPNDFNLSYYHKATVNELIEHFKEKE